MIIFCAIMCNCATLFSIYSEHVTALSTHNSAFSYLNLVFSFSLCSSCLLANIYILALASTPCRPQLTIRDTNYPCLKCLAHLLGISPFLIDHCCCGYSMFNRDSHICWIPLLNKYSSTSMSTSMNSIFCLSNTPVIG